MADPVTARPVAAMQLPPTICKQGREVCASMQADQPLCRAAGRRSTSPICMPGFGRPYRSEAPPSLCPGRDRRSNCAVQRRLRLNQPTRTSAPPSTGSATPVMKLASSEARNSAALAASHAVPIRPRSGTLASRSAATSARLRLLARARVSTAIGVSISPGKMQLARMPYGAFCRASCSVNALIAALVAL